MIASKTLKGSLRMTAQWFRNSGVMLPVDGSWGVAERVLLTHDNETCEKTLYSFPAWTPFKDYCIVEQRRADCNLETAFLFLKLHEIFGEQELYDTAENILSFLYFRSGLLNRFGDGDKSMIGAWDWSHIKRSHNIYFDDDSWMVALALKIARKHPKLDRRFEMKKWALLLADLMADAFPRYFKNRGEKELSFAWLGNTKLPHWGSLVCMALSEAYKFNPKPEYRAVVDSYNCFLTENAGTLTVSEFGYALMGCTASYRTMKDEASLNCARMFADRIVGAMNPENGSLPSEHYEAPSGKGLVDTIYTMNWAVLGLQNMASLDDRYSAPLEKMLSLLLKIQDRTRKKHLYGCWRGMFDLETGKWGGGDRFEGGANSIYTGWTNAPIAWAVAFSLQKSNLAGD